MSLDQIAAAFDRKDYKSAARLLKAFLQTSPDHPWGHLYKARLYEVSNNFEGAIALYQQLLKTVTHPKIMSQARQGLQRIASQIETQRQQAIEQAKSAPENTEPGLLVLEAIAPETRTQAAKDFARILNLDVYTARLQLPNRGWKMYRLGAIGELDFYTQQLRAANIPAFCAPEASLKQITVFEVTYFLDYAPQAIVVCQNDQGQLGSLTFDWSEVSQRVEGQLPIFERVIDSSMREGVQRQRKEKTQDYVQICDLHLPTRRCILRLCDWRYRFEQGIEFGAMGDATIELDQAINRLHWNSLLNFLTEQTFEKSIWSDFTSFGETAIEFPLLLDRLPTQIHSYGQDESLWGAAFQLYSNLAFIRDSQ
ncbi:tetratricopeptide repeat protein [Leptolyngbya sp. FACHB-17]|uniref:tetratricopeptide repeat protein n=1 Tax=unclassified Leptolyngbya TaxID=2650499 RepID=UPI0016819FF3|nr:tetratricopeptide repeat protein [Leptolyngbya sp. FACHB-17]MBD2082251.1 tetratricopeptide repeat protein [Leptolyngbya sp. FACHB-17]